MNRPNVIILILDSMRAHSMSLYGYPVVTTPCIANFASNASVYDRAISPALWTIPSHASILSGLYPSQHFINNTLGNRRFNDALVTLPEALRRCGYATAAFSQNPFFSRSHGLGDGFSCFFEVDDPTGSLEDRTLRRLARSPVRLLRRTALVVERLRASREAFRIMLEWMQENNGRDQPVFCFANLLAPHFPWIVPPNILLRAGAVDLKYLVKLDYITLKRIWEFNSGMATPSQEHLRMWRKLYDAAIMHVDAVFGRFIEQASHWPGWANTIVVVASDHGEMLGDYRGIVGHSLTMSDKLIHVPLIVRHPERRDGRRVREIVQTVDLYRTVLEWTKTPLDAVPAAQVALPSLDDPPGSRIALTEEDYSDGHDVLSRLKAMNPALDDNAYPWTQRAARSVSHKYVAYETGPGEFYDLRADPGESHNLIDTADPDELNSLRQLQASVLAWETDRDVFPPRELDGTVERSIEVEERLRALGYLP